MFFLIISGSNLNMVEVGLKSRSLGQILVKSSSQSVDQIFLKLAQNVDIDDIWVKLKHDRDWVKK